MTKIKAVLDQETWVEVDVPDEFQAIAESLCSQELLSEKVDLAQGNMDRSYSDVAMNNDDSRIVGGGSLNAQQHSEQIDSSDVSGGKTEHVKPTSADTIEKSKADVTTPTMQINNTTVKERGKSSSQTLLYKGVGYHMVNWLVSSFFFTFSGLDVYGSLHSLLHKPS